MIDLYNYVIIISNTFGERQNAYRTVKLGGFATYKRISYSDHKPVYCLM